MTILCISYSTISNAQRGTRVGYIDMDIILESVEEYNKASLLLDKSIETVSYTHLTLPTI